MNLERMYRSPWGRGQLRIIQFLGMYRLASLFLRTRLSRHMINGYIEKNNIDMSPFEGQKYRSFAEFFGRQRADVPCEDTPEVLISPCDGMLSVYEITEGMNIPMKGSHYRLIDLVPDEETAREFDGGLCLVFRLRPSDYHHICAFDDLNLVETHFIPGKLHSVQPIACEKYPVYRLNRRWWSILDSRHFGRVLQVEIGAMLVGGVKFEKESGTLERGDEFGAFELCGSTVILLLNGKARQCLELFGEFEDAVGGENEIPVYMGGGIGRMRNPA